MVKVSYHHCNIVIVTMQAYYYYLCMYAYCCVSYRSAKGIHACNNDVYTDTMSANTMFIMGSITKLCFDSCFIQLL